MKPLTQLVVEYIEDQGFEVVDSIALEIADNLEVAAQDPMNLVDIYKRLNLEGADVLVVSACVQMPSLEAIDIIEKEIGIPVTSAAVCTTYEMLKKLGLDTKVPMGGALLSGKY
jgi:maleate isomerase